MTAVSSTAKKAHLAGDCAPRSNAAASSPAEGGDASSTAARGTMRHVGGGSRGAQGRRTAAGRAAVGRRNGAAARRRAVARARGALERAIADMAAAATEPQARLCGRPGRARTLRRRPPRPAAPALPP